MLKAVLFDVDGTLAETEEFHRCAFNAAFSDLGMGVSWSASEYRHLLRVTGGKERIAAYFQGRGNGIAPHLVRSLHESKNAHYGRMMRGGLIRLRPGVERLLDDIEAAGLRLGIATTTSAQNLDVLLGATLSPYWRQRFSAIVAGDEVPRKKPAPDVYLECLRRLDLDAAEAVAIEDSRAGIDSARAAGLAVLVTPGLYTQGDDFSAADAVVPNLGEPGHPWPAAVAGFGQGWVRVEDLRGLAAAAQADEITQ